MRIAFGSFLGIFGLLAYIMAASYAYDVVAGLAWPWQALYFAVAGLVWVVPMRSLMYWTARRA